MRDPVSRFLPLILLAALVGTARAQEGRARAADLDEALAGIVDAPDPTVRDKRIKRLAGQEDLSSRELLAAMRRFGRFEKVLPGFDQVRVRVAAGDGPASVVIDYYVPQGYDPAEPTPLLVSFHATGADGGSGLPMWQSLADEAGFLLVSPFEPGPNEGYKFTRHERRVSLGAVRWARRRFNVDENRVFLTGISRGGHLAWDLALRYPDRFAAIAPMVGGPRWNIAGGQNNLRYIENVASMSIRDLQGLRDDPGLVFNLNLAFEKLDRLGAKDAKLLTFPELGHSFEFGAVDWAAWFGGATRSPVPERVVRMVVRKDEGRAYWVEAVTLDRKVQEVFPVKVDPRKWNALDDAGKKRHMVRLAEARTGRIAGRMTAPGQFEVTTKRVKKVRLLLSQAMFTQGEPIVVKWNGRPRKKPVRTSLTLLLTDFAARFDRTFLPVGSVTLP